MDNKFRQPLYILALTIVLLFFASFVKIDFQFWGLQLRNVDIFSDIKTDNNGELQNSVYPENDNKLLAFNEFNNAGRQSLNYASLNIFPTDALSDVLFVSLNPQGKFEPISGNAAQLDKFFRALKNSRNQIVRVAHFGDSAIEGDLITAALREVLQKRFGGNAVGWLGITSQDISFRTTTRHAFSGNWETGALYTSNPNGLPMGMSGECNVPQGNSWVSYETTRSRSNLRDFSLVRLFYSHAKSSQIYYSFDHGSKQSATLRTGDDIQELRLNPSRNVRSVKIEFPMKDQGYFYGVSLEDQPGVYVDNFPLRGNTGVDLLKIDESTLKQFDKFFNYKLIILEFGMNIAGTRRTDYSWYEREMVKVVQHFKSAFPQASLLLIGVSDKAMKRGSSFVTDPTIFGLMDAQKGIAQQTNIAIWSMYDAMGGENSMPKWVDANPPLAYKDYIHFNEQGAQKIAELLTDALMSEYNKFK